MKKSKKLLITIFTGLLIMIIIAIIVSANKKTTYIQPKEEYDRSLGDSIINNLKRWEEYERKNKEATEFEKNKFKPQKEIEKEMMKKNEEYYDKKREQQKYFDSLYGK